MMSEALHAEIDLSKQYAQYKNVLKDAKEGAVVTRFPPEPSGYLHIGHCKAALLNFHYAKIYQGKMILRFDDTNPSKEKDEYVQSIIEDLKTLKITWDQLTHTSDYFDKLQEIMEVLLKEGKCYCDDTPVEKMRKERDEGVESHNRTKTPEENLKIFQEMREGKADTWCVRGKCNMLNKNKCMRDPVFFRVNSKVEHHRTGTKYKAYPTYDFACPIVDSIEGVTHCLRTNEYADRIEMYNWVIKATGLRPVNIYEYSRLNFVNTCLSKRKLQWFVDSKRVESWEDPRFPTLRGIVRRGVQIETLIEFMLEQGPSKAANLQEWDKLWAINKKYIDGKAGRYTAISKEKICTVELTNAKDEITTHMIPIHPQKPQIGNRPQIRSNLLYLEYEDASTLAVDEKITLMKWGNAKITSIEPNAEGGLILKATLMEEDKDFKTTKKINWLPKCAHLTDVDLVEYDHLINAKKIDEDMDFMLVINEVSKYNTQAFADPNLKNLQKGELVQFERRGFFIIDKVDKVDGDITNRKPVMFYIPDGKSKTMSNIGTKIDVGKMAKGGAIGKEEEKKEESKEAKPEEPKKEKKEKKPRPPKPTSDKKEDEKEKEIAHGKHEPLAETDAAPGPK
jgi:glutamyl-tRNA synthetase